MFENMVRSTALTLLWRDYCYAYAEGNFNDPADITARLSLIDDSRDEIMYQLVNQSDPDQEVIRGCREEINYQMDQLDEVIQEYLEYVGNNMNLGADYTEESIREFVQDDFHRGLQGDLYSTMQGWEEAANRAHVLVDQFSDDYDLHSEDMRNDLMKKMMDIQEENPNAQKNMELAYEDIERQADPNYRANVIKNHQNDVPVNEHIEKARSFAELFRKSQLDYYNVISTSDPEYPINVQVITNGSYVGEGRFCRDFADVQDFILRMEFGSKAQIFQDTQRLGDLEEQLKVPLEERWTRWYGDLEMYETVDGKDIDVSMISKRLGELNYLQEIAEENIMESSMGMEPVQ